jgi:hypothetical protein
MTSCEVSSLIEFETGCSQLDIHDVNQRMNDRVSSQSYSCQETAFRYVQHAFLLSSDDALLQNPRYRRRTFY